ncbi:MAG: cobalt ECF transporter T component CbiQ [Deltaproteobacteria bacterium]|nr:cobalt ECF transporter T component CbiQ [Deltaproteobacteria bacterium]
MEKGIKIPDWLKSAGAPCSCCAIGRGKGFIEKNIEAIASFIKEVLLPEGFANKNGLLQAIDPRAKLLGVILLVIAAAMLKNIPALAGFVALAAVLAAFSKITASALLKRVWPVLFFTFVLVLPTAFNFITAGDPVTITSFSVNHHDLYISRQGLEGITVLLLRVAAMVSLVSLFMLTTNYPDVFRALQSFPIPKIFVAALSMTFRYIMVLIKIAEEGHLARKARTIKPSTVRESRGWLANRIWLIMERSLEMAEDVYLAMTARGFSGEVKTMTAFEMKGRDYAWIGFAIFVFLLSVQL